MKITPSQVRVAARMLSTDVEICAMLGLTPEQLERYRKHITTARAQAYAAVASHVRVDMTHQQHKPTKRA